MSYCRWSSDNYQCDLYCYESSLGYQTHVGSYRVVGDVPVLPEWGRLPEPEWVAQMVQKCAAQHAYLDIASRVPIGLPYDGESFSDTDLEGFLERLLDLRALGYRFPEYVLDVVREEIACRDGTTT